MRSLVGAPIAALLAVALASGPASSAKVIEWWKLQKGKPAEKVEPQTPTTEGQPSTTETQATTTETPPATDAAQARLAEILRQAGARSGLKLSGDVTTLSADDLKPPEPAPVEAAAEAEPATEETSAEAPPPTVSLPAPLADEPVTDYAVVALAAAEFAHPKGQTIRAAIVEAQKAADAWGLFSRNRGTEPLVGLGQAANWGRDLRIWKGRYAIVLASDPPDPAFDKVRLTKLGRDIAAALAGAGAPPEVVSWLPSGNQLAHTAIYFHANGPVSSEALALSPTTEGVAAEYQMGENVHGGVIVRYPDDQAAMAGWAAFVKARIGGDPSSGTPGSRRVAPENNRWNGVRTRGRVCAFVLGAASRNQAEVLLGQAIGRAGG
ncbi:MAG: hypothetical protein FJX75_12595 [Armatimonadetes bacterium]|nr:hypothetical protein [Armatimonadota bacterium]